MTGSVVLATELNYSGNQTDRQEARKKERKKSRAEKESYLLAHGR